MKKFSSFFILYLLVSLSISSTYGYMMAGRQNSLLRKKAKLAENAPLLLAKQFNNKMNAISAQLAEFVATVADKNEEERKQIAEKILNKIQEERSQVQNLLAKMKALLEESKDSHSFEDYDANKKTYEIFQEELVQLDQQIENLKENLKYDPAVAKSPQSDQEWDSDSSLPDFVELKMGSQQQTSSAIEKIAGFQEVGASCMKAMVSSIPPSFCYKKGADFGRVPSECVSGYYHEGAMCYQNCRSGYYRGLLGTCWESCKPGYHDHPASCYRGIFDWYFKASYANTPYTHFTDKVACRPGEYHSGALCYRDCAKIGLVNCGIGACAHDTAACVAGIITIVADAALAVAESILFVASFGASSATSSLQSKGKKAVKQGIAQGLKNSMKKGLTVVKRLFKSKAFRQQIKKQMIKKVKEVIKDQIASAISGAIIDTICSAVGDAIIQKTDCANEMSEDFDWKDLDPTNIAHTVASCNAIDGNNGSPNDELDCAKNALTAIDTVDPTGLLGLAAAFIQPVCDV